jgi:hypothetical protein
MPMIGSDDDALHQTTSVKTLEANAPAKHADIKPDCSDCDDTGMRDSGGFQPWGEAIFVPCDCRPAPSYGYHCAFDCNAQFEGEPGEPADEVEKRASAAGWHRGPLDVRAHQIACPDCKDLIRDARPLAAPTAQATDTTSHVQP